MSDVVISSGHGKYVRGAHGILDEVDEARRVVEAVAERLRKMGFDVDTYHDDVSHEQGENLERIVDYHNSRSRRFDVSVHFNAYEQVDKPMGTEVLYTSQSMLAAEMSAAIAECGLIDRGAKKRDDLYFLNNTAMPAILIEVCFVDSAADAELYNAEFENICDAIASVAEHEEELEEPDVPFLFYARGKCSHFGGPDDRGVSDDEGLAFIYEVMEAPQLFLPYQPNGSTGLARRLNPWVHYVACRWNYDITPKEMLANGDMALVRGLRTGVELLAFPADWGPHGDTDRVADLSPGLLEDLGLKTDDEVEVIYPWRKDDYGE